MSVSILTDRPRAGHGRVVWSQVCGMIDKGERPVGGFGDRQRDAVDGDRSFGHDVAHQLRRGIDVDVPGVADRSDRRDPPGAVDVALDDVAVRGGRSTARRAPD